MKNILSVCFTFLISIPLFSQGIPPREEVNLDNVYNQYNLTGEGVLVIMLDRGIDYRHPDFLDENGNTRIAYIYDMLNPSGAGSNPYGIGTIFTQAQIDAALDNNDPPLSTDRHGHGTATTGIAVGNGSGTAGLEFQGVAPKATIISIKITQDSFPPFGSEPGQTGFFDPSYLPVAMQFAADKIAELGLPAVTLMNIGSIGGPTDGTSTVARAIDDFVTNTGTPFLCGVGDDGGNNNHASGTINPSETIEIEIQKGETGNVRFDLWYSEDDRFTVSIERPNGTIHGPYTAPTGANVSADQNLGDIQLYHRGANVEFWQATSNRRELMIDISGVTGTYKVILQGAQINNGNFHATLNPSTYYNNNRFLTFANSGYSINDYASSNLVITPGDYVVKNDWVDINGVFRDITGQGETGEIWIGSSSSPTQDGRLGIDFAAPGEVCHAAYADNTYYESFAFNVLQNSNGLYGIQNAVSAAAPLSLGVIALMLEVNPNLTPLEIKNILHDTARQDTNTGAVPNDTWGYGKLDALAAINEAYASLGVSENKELNATIYPNPSNGEFTILISDKSQKIRIELYNTLGQFLKGNNYETTNPIQYSIEGASGLYFLKIINEEKDLQNTIKILKN
ncbi:MAG: S8 family peptidase [Flavobacteriaceae bacterium]